MRIIGFTFNDDTKQNKAGFCVIHLFLIVCGSYVICLSLRGKVIFVVCLSVLLVKCIHLFTALSVTGKLKAGL